MLLILRFVHSIQISVVTIYFSRSPLKMGEVYMVDLGVCKVPPTPTVCVPLIVWKFDGLFFGGF
jgi:hypothetical protein